MAKTKRQPKNQGSLSINDIASNVYNERSGGNKTLTVGPQLRTPPDGTVIKAVDFSAGSRINPGTSLALYNNSGTVAWVTMSKVTIGSAPSSLATGIPLVPNGWTYLSSGENTNIRTSAATVGVYVIEDDTTLSVINEEDSF